MGYILAVDNNKTNLEYLSYLFTSQGYSVRTALTVSEGLEIMEEQTPALILSDLNIPLRSGFDFLKQVKRAPRWVEIPFLMLSSTSHSSFDVSRAQNLGASKFIFRPIGPQELLGEVEPFLEPAQI